MIRALLRRVLPAVLALALSPVVAQAQWNGGRSSDRPGDFDFYVLALSWSPGFCELSGDSRRNREQCGDGAGLRFVVHGLCPQRERGFPTDCGPERPVTRMALDEAGGVYPTESLARYQWRKHGTCTGSSPSAYYADVKRAHDRVVIPPALKSLDREQSWSAIEIERAFVDANPGLRTDMMAVACRRGVLQEVRICFTRDLRGFRTCQEVDRQGCRTGDLTVAPPR